MRAWLLACLLVCLSERVHGARGASNSLGSVASKLNPINIGTQAWDRTFGALTNSSAADIAKRITESAVPGVRHRIITDVQLGGHRLVEMFQTTNGTVLDCNRLGDKDLIEGILSAIPESLLTKVTPEEMQEFLDLCDGIDPNAEKSGLKSFFDFIGDTLRSLFIFPGTKWCGAGDVAKNYDDLGRNKETDKCCREHDHSSDYIGALKTKHGITNKNLYTMTNCKDDSKFYNCLLNDSSLASATVGRMFFNVLRTQCFNFSYPKKCVKNKIFYVPLLTKKCKEYRLDESKPKEWQTFPPPNFDKDYRERKRTQREGVNSMTTNNVTETEKKEPVRDDKDEGNN